jgi:hypothetical protein
LLYLCAQQQKPSLSCSEGRRLVEQLSASSVNLLTTFNGEGFGNEEAVAEHRGGAGKLDTAMSGNSAL